MTRPVGDFIRCELTLKRPTSKVMIRWTKLDEVYVSIQLPGRGAASSALRARVWQGVPREADKLQETLATVSAMKIGRIHDHMLAIRHPQKKMGVTVMWAANMEPHDLRDLRTMLEQIAHLPYAEALAYREEAQAVAAHHLFEPAIRLVRAALQALDTCYLSDGLVDDSDAQLVLANYLQTSGNLAAAWTAFRNVADSRLSAFRQLHGVREKLKPEAGPKR